MPELRFDTGLVSYSINGAAEVSFNPTDLSFMQRIFRTFDLLEEKQQEYEKARGDVSDNKSFFELSRRMDNEMREVIDEAFGKPVCADVFGSMNVYAVAGGLPVWCNLIFSVIDLFDASVTAETAKTNPRLEQYLKKYRK